MSRRTRTKTEEQKLPKYVPGMSVMDFQVKYLTAAGTRGKTRMILEGEYKDILPPWTYLTGGGKIRELSRTMMEIEAENKRAFAELLNCMPNGKLTALVADAKTEEYPEGCAATAWERVIEEIGKKSSDDKRRLKEMFESEHQLRPKTNPAKYIDKLVEIQKELRLKYNYEKTDEDIIDQVIKVVNDKYEFLIDQIIKDRRDGNPVTIEGVRAAFNEKHLLLKRRKARQSKGKVEISDDSSDGEVEEIERGYEARSTGNLRPGGNAGSAGMGTRPFGAGMQRNYGTPNRFQPYVRRFTGMCNYCGVQGHKAVECPEKPQNTMWNRTRRTNGKCIHCNRDTHPSDKCWELDKNALLRPPNWVSIKTWNQQRDNAQGANVDQPPVVRVCVHCESPKHMDDECPIIKLKNLETNEEQTRRTKHVAYTGRSAYRNWADDSDDDDFSGGTKMSGEYGFLQHEEFIGEWAEKVEEVDTDSGCDSKNSKRSAKGYGSGSDSDWSVKSVTTTALMEWQRTQLKIMQIIEADSSDDTEDESMTDEVVFWQRSCQMESRMEMEVDGESDMDDGDEKSDAESFNDSKRQDSDENSMSEGELDSMVGSWNSEDMVEAEIEQESESECATWGTENGMMKIQRVLLGMSEDHVFKGEIAMMARDELNKTDGDTKEDSGEGANKIMEDTNGEMEAKINGVWLENG